MSSKGARVLFLAPIWKRLEVAETVDFTYLAFWQLVIGSIPTAPPVVLKVLSLRADRPNNKPI